MVKMLTSATLLTPETAPKVTPQERPKADTKSIPEDPHLSKKVKEKDHARKKKTTHKIPYSNRLNYKPLSLFNYLYYNWIADLGFITWHRV